MPKTNDNKTNQSIMGAILVIHKTERNDKIK